MRAMVIAEQRPIAEVEREQRRCDGHDRTDRQVDPLGADDQRHPERDDGDRNDLDELQPDVVDLREARREHEVEGDKQEQPDVDAPVGDPGEDLGAIHRPAVGRELSRRHVPSACA